MTPRSLETFAESINQPLTTPPNSKLAKVVAYAWGMREGSIITIPIDIELFSTEMAICVMTSRVHRPPGDKHDMYLFVHEVSN